MRGFLTRLVPDVRIIETNHVLDDWSKLLLAWIF